MTAIPAVETVLSLVLQAHGATCGCEGACGKDHSGDRCGKANQLGKPKLTAAPYPPRSTDAENIAAPLEQLRPWCGPCWRKATERVQQDAAEARRQELEAAQLDLFDLPGGAAA
ncbi:hypothetical protein ABZ957_15520 [Streptomyces sp. NPDC046316]|uniref:hypothetical protein n=1 Tax=Streptomyces sp. NPDC046316 TaxID=3154494 RepID=UPI003401067C